MNYETEKFIREYFEERPQLKPPAHSRALGYAVSATCLYMIESLLNERHSQRKMIRATESVMAKIGDHFGVKPGDVDSLFAAIEAQSAEGGRLKAIETAARNLHTASVRTEGGYLQAGDRVLVDLERALYHYEAPASGSPKRTCDFNGGGCTEPATSEVKMADTGKWYACCDGHASHARRGRAEFRDLTADDSSQEPGDENLRLNPWCDECRTFHDPGEHTADSRPTPEDDPHGIYDPRPGHD